MGQTNSEYQAFIGTATTLWHELSEKQNCTDNEKKFMESFGCFAGEVLIPERERPVPEETKDTYSYNDRLWF